MPDTVLLNGSFLAREDARVSAFDAGLQHGVGLFETMLGLNGDGGAPRVVALREHAARIGASARALGLSETLNEDALAEACLKTLAESGLPRARVRLTITGGDLNLLERAAETQHRPTLLVNAQPATAYPDAMFDRGVRVALADARANPLDPTAGHKTLNYWWRLRELQAASAKGAAEALVFQISNHLAGGCVSNAVAIKGDRAYTPIARGEEADGGLPSPVLPGTTRAVVLGWLEEMGLEIHRQMVAVADVLEADELVLTNSSWGVLPVVGVEAQDIGPGEPGAVAASLIERWRAFTG